MGLNDLNENRMSDAKKKKTEAMDLNMYMLSNAIYIHKYTYENIVYGIIVLCV